jgi:2-polyprenyl-3-methyl-5-hydroxy-6-metoxy-1,4-benzoquinol methylase
MCENIIKNLSIDLDSKVLDYGCAKGYLVKAFHILGVKNTYGLDISEYAIRNCDPAVTDHVRCLILDKSLSSQVDQKYDWIICKDVLEHLQKDELTCILKEFRSISSNLFVAVPLGKDGKYFIE